MKIQARLAAFQRQWLGRRLLPLEWFAATKLRLFMMQ